MEARASLQSGRPRLDQDGDGKEPRLDYMDRVLVVTGAMRVTLGADSGRDIRARAPGTTSIAAITAAA